MVIFGADPFRELKKVSVPKVHCTQHAVNRTVTDGVFAVTHKSQTPLFYSRTRRLFLRASCVFPSPPTRRRAVTESSESTTASSGDRLHNAAVPLAEGGSGPFVPILLSRKTATQTHNASENASHTKRTFFYHLLSSRNFTGGAENIILVRVIY